MHAVPSCPENPAGHLQSVDAALVAFETELAGHAVHTDALMAAIAVENVPLRHDAQASLPGCCLNFPGTQLVHVDPSGPENPTEHRHTVLPAMEMAFVGHELHVDSNVAPMPVENLPTPHETHT